MSTVRHRNYLRTHRRKIGLTQAEVAFLVGSKNPMTICRYERDSQIPNLETVLAYEYLFQTPPRIIFYGLVERIKQETNKRIEELLRKSEKKPPHLRQEATITHLTNLLTQ